MLGWVPLLWAVVDMLGCVVLVVVVSGVWSLVVDTAGEGGGSTAGEEGSDAVVCDRGCVVGLWEAVRAEEERESVG